MLSRLARILLMMVVIALMSGCSRHDNKAVLFGIDGFAVPCELSCYFYDPDGIISCASIKASTMQFDNFSINGSLLNMSGFILGYNSSKKSFQISGKIYLNQHKNHQIYSAELTDTTSHFRILYSFVKLDDQDYPGVYHRDIMEPLFTIA